MIVVSSIFIFNVTNLCVILSFFLTKFLTLGVLFLTAVRAVVVVAKLIILGISHLTSFILALREALVAKLVIFHILPLTLYLF